ncbi:hypothetical protein BD770DRAFT_404080, partial [Pilaira anomala]
MTIDRRTIIPATAIGLTLSKLILPVGGANWVSNRALSAAISSRIPLRMSSLFKIEVLLIIALLLIFYVFIFLLKKNKEVK